MNICISLQQKSKTGDRDSSLISPQYKLNWMANFMQIRFENPKLQQSEIANHLGYSSSTLNRYTNDIYIGFHLMEFNQITPKNEQKKLQIQILITFHIANMTSKDLKWLQRTLKQLRQIQNQKTKTKIF